MINYEQKLDSDADWALREGGWHFDAESSVHKCLRRIARRLEELRIPYAVVGGMALFFHGYRRFTEDVDILVTAEGWKAIQDRLAGLGWVAPSAGSRQLRDPESGVRIDFLVSGGFPGDGRPQPIAFPTPDESVTVLHGIRFLGLLKLVELKLASGATPGRRRDWADVQELIRALGLSADFADRLAPSVRQSFRQLWLELHPPDQGA